ncbi:Protein of unknown function [Gryllus bimaculatus]|nr:Protein of unknown function [Gryllus bimaculatus]
MDSNGDGEEEEPGASLREPHHAPKPRTGRRRRHLHFCCDLANLAAVTRILLHKKRPLQFSSFVPILLAVTQEPENIFTTQTAPKPKTRDQNEARKLFTHLWKRHQSLRGFLVVEDESGSWQKYYPKHTVLSGEVKVEITQAISRSTKKFSTTEFPKFLRGAYISIFYPSCLLDYTQIDVRPLGISSEMIGPHLRFLYELHRRLHFFFVRDHDLRVQENKLCKPSKNRSILFENWLISTAFTELVLGRIQFLGMPLDVMNDAPGDIIAASLTGNVVTAVVPRARPLPAWDVCTR